MTDLPFNPDKGQDQAGAEVAFPWYEARLSVHVRPRKPTDTFGEGGEELAHVRAYTQADSFVSALLVLDRDLGAGWDKLKAHADLVDQEPSPDVMPKPVPWHRRVVTVPLWSCALMAWWTALAILVIAR